MKILVFFSPKIFKFQKSLKLLIQDLKKDSVLRRVGEGVVTFSFAARYSEGNFASIFVA